MLDVDIKARAGAFVTQAKFALPSDATIALFGRSGAGKTTILHALAGLIAPESGTIRLNQTTFFSSAESIHVPAERRRIGYVFQEGRLFPHLSVEQNLAYGAKRAQGSFPQDQHQDELVALLDLGSLLKRRTPSLSGGEKQRVAIARALLAQPRLLLLDEPLAALDAPRKAEIMSYIERLREATRVPMVIVTHILDEVVRLSDFLVVIDQGMVQAADQTATVLARPDLFRFFGDQEASSLIEGTLAEAATSEFLGRVMFAGGTLKVPALNKAKGATIRVRVRASDVAIALAAPTDTSIANILPARVAELSQAQGDTVQVLLDLGGSALLASVSRESAARLQLVPGQSVFALVKSIALIESDWISRA